MGHRRHLVHYLRLLECCPHPRKGVAKLPLDVSSTWRKTAIDVFSDIVKEISLIATVMDIFN